ncbi:MAG: hypothetical protein ACTS2F_25280 [Thainema sp.]
MAILYFVQAASIAPGLAHLPVAKFLEGELNFDAIQLSWFQEVILIPWFFKPIWGILADTVPLMGYFIKPYFFICYGLILSSFLTLSQLNFYTVNVLLAASLIISTSISFTDVLTDRLMIVQGKRLNAISLLQATQWIGLGFSAMGVYVWGGWLADNASLSTAFLLSTVIPCIGIIVISKFIDEPLKQERILLKQHLKNLKEFILSNQVLSIFILVICIGITPKTPIWTSGGI